MRSVKVTLSFVVLLVAAATVPAQSERLKLRPSADYWFSSGKRAPVRVSRLGGDRRLAAVGDMLYMLDGRGRVLWSWSTGGPPLTGRPVVDSKGTIYVIGYDLLWAAVDSASGREKWRGTANGRASYSQIEAYGDDLYLVVTDMGGYREYGNRGEVINDELTLCRGNSVLWETEIPAGSRIEVRGGEVFAVYGRRSRRASRRIDIPRRFDRPIGKVSALADYE